MMEELLRNLSLRGSQVGLEQRLIEIWIPVSERIISSEMVKSPPWSLRQDINKILGLLIFSDPTGIISWKVDGWKPLWQVTGFIKHWVETVGHNPDCFKSLVLLLKGIGFSLMPEFGVDWLYQCIKHSDDGGKLIERAKITNALAELLQDSWSRQRPLIEKETLRLRQFVFLVDITAKQGAQVAVRLQTQLQRD
jgi:hypothetical protein